jgi:uncharacterized protein YodC (DUF2158 family)
MSVTAIDSRIKPGDIVRLKTGGPPMVVCRIVKHKEFKDDEAECYWWGWSLSSGGGTYLKTLIPWGKMFPLPCLNKAELRKRTKP